jgi:serine/threonine protein kinase
VEDSVHFRPVHACASPDPATAYRDTRTRDPLDHLLAGARPVVDEIERAVARARAESALFGDEAGPPRIGRYRVVQRAGAGGMGVVWEAHDPELERAVAIKLVRAESAAARERVLAEGQALARLSHPNVVPVFDVGLHGDQVFLVMELVRGETLRQHVAAAPRDPRAIAQIYRQAGEGLAAAHRAGLVHRDFKPDNAIVGRDGRVRIVDFGLACPPGLADDAPDVPPVIGTPRYMAPEQAAGGVITAAADQYAFCASLREALTPRAGDVGRATTRWLEAIIARGTRADPAARFPSMDEVTRALAREPRGALRSRLRVVAAAALAAGAFAIGRGSHSGEPTGACNGRCSPASLRSPSDRQGPAAASGCSGAVARPAR